MISSYQITALAKSNNEFYRKRIVKTYFVHIDVKTYITQINK